MSKKIISFEIPEDLYDKVRQEAFEKRTTVSATIREILKNYFEMDAEDDK